MSDVTKLTLAALALGAIIPAVLAQMTGESVVLRDPSDKDIYAAGRDVELLAPTTGDAVLAGQRVTVDGAVSEDLIAAGEIVLVRASIGDDVRAAGREVSLESSAGGHVVAAGQHVSIGSGASVGDWAWLAGERVVIRGSIGQELRAAGQQVVIAGSVAGDADVAAERIVVESGAVIGGDLIVRGRHEAEISDGAEIRGQVITKDLPEQFREGDEALGFPGTLFISVSVLVALLVFYWLFPQFMQRSAKVLTGEPLKALGAGFVVLLVTPLLAIALIAIGIGFLLGLPLAAVYLVTLLTGYLVGLFTLGDFVARRVGFDVATAGRRVLVVVLSIAAVALISLIPVVGPLALFALCLAGIGACLLTGYRVYREIPVV